MVLAGGQRQHIFAVHHDNETGLFALQKFFYHHAGLGLAIVTRVVHDAQRVVQQHEVNGRMRFLNRHRHHHAFARRQPIGFDDNGRAHFVNVSMRQSRVGKRLKRRRGDAVALHEGFGKRF